MFECCDVDPVINSSFNIQECYVQSYCQSVLFQHSAAPAFKQIHFNQNTTVVICIRSVHFQGATPQGGVVSIGLRQDIQQPSKQGVDSSTGCYITSKRTQHHPFMTSTKNNQFFDTSPPTLTIYKNK